MVYEIKETAGGAARGSTIPTGRQSSKKASSADKSDKQKQNS